MRERTQTPSLDGILPYKEDKYDGVVIGELPSDPQIFSSQLSSSMALWRSAGKKGIWLRVPIPSRSEHFEVAIRHGFEPHHAEPDQVTLNAWLPAGSSTLPLQASHYVGVGVAVLNDEGKLLVVQERNGPLKGRNFWKVPTGMVDPNEHLLSAAKREVMEETGVEVEVDGIVCLRETHGQHVQCKTDLFFLCKARPLSKDINPQASEILKAEWMPLDRYLALPQYSKPGTVPHLLQQVMRDHLTSGDTRHFTSVSLPRGHMRGNATVHYVRQNRSSML